MSWPPRRRLRARVAELEQRVELLESILSDAQRRERVLISQALHVVAIARAEGMLPEADHVES